MKFLESRRQYVFGVALLIFVAALIYGAVINSDNPSMKYAGLKLDRGVQMEDDVRGILERRIKTTQAGLEAQKVGNPEDLDWNLYILLANDANLIGDLVLERETYEEFLELNPIHFVTWNNYAETLSTMGDDERAEEAYRKALELNPMEEYYRDLIVHIEKTSDGERDDEVLQILKDGVEELGQTGWSMVTIAQWYMAHDDCTNALEHYSVAETLIPQNEGLIIELGEARVTCAQE